MERTSREEAHTSPHISNPAINLSSMITQVSRDDQTSSSLGAHDKASKVASQSYHSDVESSTNSKTQMKSLDRSIPSLEDGGGLDVCTATAGSCTDDEEDESSFSSTAQWDFWQRAVSCFVCIPPLWRVFFTSSQQQLSNQNTTMKNQNPSLQPQRDDEESFSMTTMRTLTSQRMRNLSNSSNLRSEINKHHRLPSSDDLQQNEKISSVVVPTLQKPSTLRNVESGLNSTHNGTSYDHTQIITSVSKLGTNMDTKTNNVTCEESASIVCSGRYISSKFMKRISIRNRMHSAAEGDFVSLRKRTLLPPGSALLPPQLTHLKGRKTLILDLDETLVHSSFSKVSSPDIIVNVEIENIFNPVYVRKRPGLDEFLTTVSSLYEVIVFTASLSKYADPLLDQLDGKGTTFHGRLFREHCTFVDRCYKKDLSRLGRALEHTIIIDNSPICYDLQPENAIPITSWFDDDSDCELLELLPWLERIASHDDHVYDILDEYRRGLTRRR